MLYYGKMETQKTEEFQIPQKYFETNEPILGQEPLFYLTAKEIGEDGKERVKVHFIPNVGVLNYVVGAPFPRKGIVKPEILHTLGIMKQKVRSTLKRPNAIFAIQREIQEFNELFHRGMKAWTVDEIYLNKCAKQVKYMVLVFLRELGFKDYERTAHHFAQFFEFDDGWMLRLLDVGQEVDLGELMKNPQKEIKRVYKIYRSREVPYVADKVWSMIRPLLWLLYIPKVKRAFKMSAAFLKEMHYDEGDWYWARNKVDYMHGGLTPNQKMESLTNSGYQVATLFRMLEQNGRPVDNW